MKKFTAVLLSTCMSLAVGSAFAQDAMKNDDMAKDAMGKDAMAKDRHRRTR